jgi:hypothetical protein
MARKTRSLSDGERMLGIRIVYDNFSLGPPKTRTPFELLVRLIAPLMPYLLAAGAVGFVLLLVLT